MAIILADCNIAVILVNKIDLTISIAGAVAAVPPPLVVVVKTATMARGAPTRVLRFTRSLRLQLICRRADVAVMAADEVAAFGCCSAYASDASIFRTNAIDVYGLVSVS